MRAIIVAVALLASPSCERTPDVPPPTGPGTCETACANRARVFGKEDPRCVPDCADAAKAYEELGRRYPVACQTSAKTKDEFRACK